MPNIKDLIKDNTVNFHHYRAGFFFYYIKFENNTYSFPVPLSEIDHASLNAEEKAILFMRFIRNSQVAGTFLKVS